MSNFVNVKGKFVKIVWKNNTNTYFLVSFKLLANQDQVKQKLGISSSLNNIVVFIDNNNFEFKLNYEIELEIQKSEKYGLKYIVKKYNLIFKDDYESSILFLSSKLFYGISEKTAKKIIDKFGTSLINDPHKYKSQLIDLIGEKKSLTIIQGIDNENTYQKLFKIFIENSLSVPLLNTINDVIPSYEIDDFLSTEKLFEFMEKIDGIDFFELVSISKVFNSSFNEELKNKYMIIWILLKLEFTGSTVISIAKVFNEFNNYTLITRSSFTEYLKQLIIDNKIILSDDKQSLTLKSTYENEKYIVNRLLELSKNKKKNTFKKDIIYENLDEQQVKALQNALDNNVSIITGSPGTGKTAIFSLLVKNFENNNIRNVECLAPTGKAATQISIKSNKETKTIHSFLRWNKIDYDVNELNPSDAKIIIIDEFSMVDIKLFCAILKATPFLEKIILIGDKDQLPSIKCGYLLNDLILSGKFQTSFLHKIYRQKEGSLIIENALLINQGIYPNFNNTDSFLKNVNSEFEAFDQIKMYMEDYLSKNDIYSQQILIPMYKGEAGIDNINNMIQQLINKNNLVLFQTKNSNYYKNDKIIQLENDIEKNVFNGEIGYIDSIIYSNSEEIVEKVNIAFDKKIISYTLNEFSQSTKLAYAISIHKFQGSECNDVLLVLLSNHKIMLSKKLLYTAYTRACRSITLISNKETIEYAISNDFDSLRSGNILKFLKDDK